jgi:cellulose synthase/poly-beta-1,6-N-acetylglucosamine synthase-like glycosyltransferase
MFFDIAFFSYGLSSLIGFSGYNYKPKRESYKARNVEFVIPTVANEKTINSLKEVIEKIRSFDGYRINIIIDEGSKLELNDKNIRIIVVPNNFDGVKCKGRAIQYFIKNYVEDNKWYVFLDDDSYPLDDNFLYEIPYYEKKGYVASNGILIPRNGKSKLTYILDFLRYFDDIFMFRLCTGKLKKGLIGFHGELLIAKGSVLKEIGFKTNTLVEDYVFSQELIKRGYMTWQSSTKVSIKSPNSLKDFWKQRARWYKGILKELKNTNLKAIPLIVLRMFGGIFSTMLLFPLWFIFPPTTPLAFFGFFGMLYYLSAYTYGILKSKSYKYFLILPFMGIFETLSLIFIPQIKKFIVIDKN